MDRTIFDPTHPFDGSSINDISATQNQDFEMEYSLNRKSFELSHSKRISNK